MRPAVRTPRVRRLLGRFVGAVLVVAGITWTALSLIWPSIPVIVHVRWTADVTEAERVDLERQFHLVAPEQTEGTTWRYRLLDSSAENIRAIVQSADVDDTAYLHRSRFRPVFAMDRSRQIAVYSMATGAIGAVLFLLLTAEGRMASSRALLRSMASAVMSPAAGAYRPISARATAAVLLAGVLAAVAMTSFAGASAVSAAVAVLAVYVCGYVVGSLLVDDVDENATLAWSVIRTVAGLLLSTAGFLLSLSFGLPWFVVPAALAAIAVARLRGRGALPRPLRKIRFGLDGIAAGVSVVIVLSPIVISAFYMAPGSFPPLFHNVDTAYFLEKVHTLITATSYPPESLSNDGGLRTYHFGTHGMAALISRVSGLSAHHSVFVVLIPLLTAGVAAAAVAVARSLSPALPYSITVPLLLVSTPSGFSSLWGRFGAQLSSAVTSERLSLDALLGPHELWGILSNEGQNVGADFLILGSLAGIAAARWAGWTLPAFLVGTGILIKTPAGIALLAGFALAEGWRMLSARRLQPSPQALAAGAVFVATYGIFWVLPLVEPDFRVELFPLYHVNHTLARGDARGLVVDILWLFLPVLIVAVAGIADPERRSAPILMLGIAPLLVVNMTRMVDMRPGLGGPDEDWLQILHSTPFLLHAFALSLAGARWTRLGRPHRAAFLLALILATLPVVAAAGRYTLLLLEDPERGHEFVDNRALGEALAVIPTTGTVLVTNDLRYPAEDFRRNGRQMQIPALYGHQAFAVNYAYEVYSFSRERRELQALLQRPEWSDAIPAAARTHGWTHLLIRKDYEHPAAIPLDRVFENQFYEVFRFP